MSRITTGSSSLPTDPALLTFIILPRDFRPVFGSCPANEQTLSVYVHCFKMGMKILKYPAAVLVQSKVGRQVTQRDTRHFPCGLEAQPEHSGSQQGICVTSQCCVKAAEAEARVWITQTAGKGSMENSYDLMQHDKRPLGCSRSVGFAAPRGQHGQLGSVTGLLLVTHSVYIPHSRQSMLQPVPALLHVLPGWARFPNTSLFL